MTKDGAPQGGLADHLVLAQGSATFRVPIEYSNGKYVFNPANVPKDAVIVNGAGEDVTDSYDISYKNGYLEVTPITAEVNVMVTGHADKIVYDGVEHEVAGYDVTADNELYLAAFTRYSGYASVKATDVGAYAMGLSKEGFSNATHNFSDVLFEVADGSLTIEAAVRRRAR